MKQHYQTIAFLTAIYLLKMPLLMGQGQLSLLSTQQIGSQNRLYAMHFTNGDDLIVVGGSDSCAIATSSFGATYLISNEGEVHWHKCFDDGTTGWIHDTKTIENDGFWAVGKRDGDGLLLRFDEEGNLLWAKNYGGTADDAFSQIRQLPDHNLLLAGYSYSSDGDLPGNYGESDIWCIKVDTTGEVIWSNHYGGSKIDVLKDVQTTVLNGLAVLGSKGESLVAGSQPWLFVADSIGLISDSHYFGVMDNGDALSSLVHTSSGDWLMAGTKMPASSQSEYHKPWVVKMAPTGEVLFDKTYDNPVSAYGEKILEYDIGHYFFISNEPHYYHVPGHTEDWWFNHLCYILDDSGGIAHSLNYITWPSSIRYFGGISNVVVNDSNQFYVLSYLQDVGGKYFGVLSKLGLEMTSSVQNNRDAESPSFNAFPNPSSSHLTIEATDPNSPIESIEVVDVLGRRIAISSDFRKINM